MTTPNWGEQVDVPEGAANYSSLSTYAAKTSEDWEAEITDPFAASAGGVRDGLWGDLPEGGGYGLTLISEVVKRIIPIDQIAAWDFIGDALTALNTWAIDVNTILGQALRDFVDFLVNLVDRSGFLDVLGELGAYLQGLGGMTLTAFLEVLDDIVGFFYGLLDRSGFLDALGTVVGFFADLGEGAIGGFLDALDALVSTVINFTNGTVDDFVQALNDIVDFLAGLVDRSSFLSTLGDVIGFFGGLVEGTLGGFLDTLQTVIEFFLGLGEGILDPFLSVLNTVISWFMSLAGTGIDEFMDAVSNLVGAVDGAVSGPLGDFFGVLADIVAFFDGLLGNTVGGFLGVVEDIVGFFDGLLGTTVADFMGTVQNIVGFFDGIALPEFNIEAFIDAINGAASTFNLDMLPLDDMVDFIKRLLIDPIIGMLTGDALKLDLSALGVWARNLLGRNDKIPASNLVGQISSALFGVIPLSSVSDTRPNLLEDGAFALPESVDGSSEWAWDADGYNGSEGCVKVTADGQSHDLFSTQSIPTAAGDKIRVTAAIKTVGYAGSGSPISVSIIPFIGVSQQTAVTMISTGAHTSWAELASNAYQVPAGVTSVRVRLAVTNAATAGTVYFDDIELTKVGLLQQGWVERLTDAWNNFWHGIFGGILPDDKDVDDVYTAAASVSATANTADSNAASALDQLGQLIWGLLNAPATILGNIGAAIIDGVKSIGDFLTGLWNAFTGGGGTDKTVDEVATAAASVTSTANTSLTNAATAQSAADEAQAEASRANAALLAAIDKGANIVPDGNFENDYICDPPPSSRSGARSTNYSRNGSYSWRVQANGATQTVQMHHNTDRVKQAWPTAPNRKYWYEAWVYAPATNSHAAGYISLHTAVTKNDGSVTYPNIYCPVSSLSKGAWNKLSGVIDVGSEGKWFYAYLRVDTTCTVGDEFYWDCVEVIDITTAWDEAVAAHATANTGVTNAATADAKAVAAQADADTALADAATADAKAVAAQEAVDLAEARLSAAAASGVNLITDPSFEWESLDDLRYAAFANPSMFTYSTTTKYSGARSLKVTQDGVSYPALYCVPSLRDWSVEANRIPVVQGQTFYVAQTVYLASPNSGSRAMNIYLRVYRADGTSYWQSCEFTPPLDQWTKTEGYITISDANAVSIAPYFASFRPTNPAGTVAYVDSMTLVDVTEAYSAKAQADAALAQANTATTNAATADGKAVAAQADADTADAKAVAAQTDLNIFAKSANLMRSPNFEDSTVTRRGYGSPTIEYTTADKFQGTQCLRITKTAAGSQGIFFEPYSGTDSHVMDCSPGDTFLASAWVKPVAGNDMSIGVVRLYVQFRNSVTGVNYQPSTYINNTSMPSSWTYMEVVGTCPEGYDQCSAFFIIPDPSPVGNSYLIDAVSWREATLANTANENAQAAQADATVGIANAATADGKAVAAQADADTADAKAVAAQAAADAAEDRFDAYLATGVNLCSNGGFEDNSLYSQHATYVTSPVLSGTYAARIVADGANNRYAVLCGNRTGHLFVASGPSRVYAVEFWVYGESGNAAGTSNGIYCGVWNYTAGETYVNNKYIALTPNDVGTGQWKRYTGTLVMDDNSTVAKVRLYALVGPGAPAGNAYIFDDVKIVDITEAYNAQIAADAAEANAQTGITNAATADGKAVAAQDDADTGIAVARSIGQVAGSNLVLNPGFEDPTAYLWATANASISTDYARTGSRSAKAVSNGTSNTSIYLFTDGVGPVRRACAPGDVFYVEVWVRGKPGNDVNATGSIYLSCEFNTGTIASPSNVYLRPVTPDPKPANIGTSSWYKIAGQVTAPANAITFLPILVMGGAQIPAGDTYYWDDIIVREVTVAANAQDAADTAQDAADAAQDAADTAQDAADAAQDAADAGIANASTADGKAVVAQQHASLVTLDPTNLLVGSHFENALGWPWWISSGASVATDQKHSGTQSLKIAATTGNYPYVAEYRDPNNERKLFRVEPGDQITIELWARKSSTYVTSDTGGPRFRLMRGDGASAGSTYANIYLRASDIPTADTWYQLSTTITIPDSDFRYIYFGVQGGPANFVGNVWLDDIAVHKVSPEFDDTWNGIVAGMTRSPASGAGATDVEDTSVALADAVAGNAAQLAAIQSMSSGGAATGRSASIAYSSRANRSDIGTEFSLTWSGSGNGTWQTVSGKAAWVDGSTNASRKAVARYNVNNTVTDYQSVTVSFGGAQEFSDSTYSKNFIFGRMNSTGTSYIYAEISGPTVKLGCVVSGATTNWVTNTIGVGLVLLVAMGTPFTLVCGTDDGERYYKLLVGDSELATHTESGTVSQLGASYRYTGMGIEQIYSGSQLAPAPVTTWTMRDSPPVSYVGSGFRYYRSSTSGTSISSTGNNLLPNSFYDSETYKTDDYEYAPATANKVTVAVEGWYLVTVAIGLTVNTMLNNMSALLYKNGSVFSRGPSGIGMVAVPLENRGPDCVSGTFMVYLQGGDYVQPGYYMSTAYGASGSMIGDSAGTKSYFEVTLLNRSFA